MEVRRLVIAVVHGYDNSKETANLRHLSRLYHLELKGLINHNNQITLYQTWDSISFEWILAGLLHLRFCHLSINEEFSDRNALSSRPGEGNNYGHPHEEVLERVADVGAAVLRTDELGTIEVITDGEQLWWETHQ